MKKRSVAFILAALFLSLSSCSGPVGLVGDKGE